MYSLLYAPCISNGLTHSFQTGIQLSLVKVHAYTNLYHARWDDRIPPDPEWFTFGVEMSYGIFSSGRNAHILTYQSVKPIGCLYFDGMSAALMGTGQLDSQMVFLYGNTTGPSQPEPAGTGPGVFGELGEPSVFASECGTTN